MALAPKPGILVISHGSRESGWVALVDETVEAAFTALPSGIPVEAAFLELVEGRLIQDGIDRLENAGVDHFLAVPLFVSSGSTHVDEIGWALGAYAQPRTDTDLEPFRVSAELTYGKPIDDDPEFADILLDRLSVLSNDPARESLLLIGHGSDKPGFHEAWRRGLSSLAATVRERGGYADADIAMLRPDLAATALGDLRARQPDTRVIALPVFLSEGYFTKEVVPRRLEGMNCRYDGRTLMPHPQVARWLERQALEWLRQFI
jgi:sirohydrochlorin ferrochelatase